MNKQHKIAYIFPGQGAQYSGMGRGFYDSYSTVRETFEEANDILGRNLSDIILNGPEDVLTQTKNSQTAIFVMSLALLRAVREAFPTISAEYTSGLSLGEYTALTAAEKLSFKECLPLVQHRGTFMNDACEANHGSMAVVLGLGADEVESIVQTVNMPNDLWAANFNCPGQVVISGTLKGIEAGTQAAKDKGAKRVLPLQVHGAFHSGLMREAEERLTPYVEKTSITEGSSGLVMNVTGTLVEDTALIKKNLIHQVTNSVRWEQSIRHLMSLGVDLFIEIGCGKSLSGFNKRIGVPVPTINIETPKDLEKLTKYF
jgi:[acyl-carrier-protein] S-malonyltransferase